ncbi:MAG: SusC/RagA family TonB-linked outer membrane protein [Bacteroidales bacterium]|nr:SusC/RagA family TonB-linked outer membrane protein [Bacteroidales bacterium]
MKKLTLVFSLFVLTGLSVLMAQTVVINGTVTSSVEGEGPIPGVSVVVKGTTMGTTTNADGQYTLTVPEGPATLVFQFIGMQKVEEEVGNRTTIDIVMEPDLLGIDEVVVTALGISREKKALGYAVQDVKGEELNQAKEANIVNSLAGKVAGVQITSNSGAVGASTQIKIRGINSFGSNQPLWVVDGTPISNSSSAPSQWGGTDYGNNAMDIDPENVESISILKGANAAALYGSRARNGVVLVTTKKGKRGQGLGVSFSSTTTFDRVSKIANYQNEYGQGANGSEFIYNRNTEPGDAYEGWTYQEWAENISFSYVDGDGNGVNDGFDESWGPRLDAGLVLDQFHGEQQPWVSHPNNVRDFYQIGITSQNNLTLNGGGEKSAARLSYTNLQQKGAIPGTDQTRNSLNVNASVMPTDDLKLSANINYVNTHNDNLPGQGYSSQNVVQSIGGWFGRQVDMKLLEENWDTMMEPTAAWPNGRPYNWNTNYHNNPYWTVYKNQTQRDRDRIFGNMTLDYRITGWLDFRFRYGLDYYNEFRKSVIYELSNANKNEGGEFGESNRTRKESNADAFLFFDKDVGSDLNLSGNLGVNYRSYDYKYFYLGASRLTVPNLFTISNVDGTPSTGDSFSKFETNSVFGALNIAFRDYLFVDFTARNDWSSTLPPDSWSYFYPSASVGWIFTETFGLGDSALSFGKLRGSWAKVGSDTGPYNLQATYGSATPFGGISQYSYPGQIPPANLQPEFTTSIEVGAELKFFMNRFGLDFTYYNNLTNNQILSVAVSRSSGFDSQLINAGEIQTSGVELQMTAGILRNPAGFNWDVTVNWSTTETVVNELAPGLDKYVLNSTWSPTTLEARVGEPYGQFYGRDYMYNEDGQLLIADDGFPVKNSDLTNVGNMMPDWIGGINNSFRYKNFNASFLIDAKWGGDIYSVTKWFGGYAGVSQETVEGGIRENGLVLDGVYESSGQPNTTAISPQAYFGGWWGMTTPALFDGTYVKLREVILGYNVPLNSNLFSNLNISIVGRNLAILYTDPSNTIGIDPETGYGTGNTSSGFEQYQLPPTQSLGFKLSVDF